MIRRFFDWLEDWVFEDPNTIIGLAKGMFVVGIAGVLVLGPIVYLAAKHDEKMIRECVQSGGTWQAVGTHQTTTYITVGKVVVPQTQTVTNYGCVGGRAER